MYILLLTITDSYGHFLHGRTYHVHIPPHAKAESAKKRDKAGQYTQAQWRVEWTGTSASRRHVTNAYQIRRPVGIRME
jgi:hypothetical protein